MTITEASAKFDSYLREHIAVLPPSIPIHVYSNARKWFLKNFSSDVPEFEVNIPEELNRTYWGIKFQTPVFNAAGIFKDGYGYEVVRRQGAGAFLIGTATPHSRIGNLKGSFKTPFLPMPSSKAALNWLGLPNLGFEEISKRISLIDKKNNCPIGISISSAPEETGLEALNNLLNGFKIFENSQIDFIELNESCPNVPHEHCQTADNQLDVKLLERLDYLSNNFLKHRNRNLPVIVKFSIDTSPELIPILVKTLVEMGFDGINLGNTSTQYQKFREQITPKEQENFDYFTTEFGGGLSGHPLKSTSLQLSKIAANTLKDVYLKREFIVIRTGGFEDIYDFVSSENSKIHLNQWFTGYFDLFSKFGHKIYQKFFNI